MDEIGWIIIGVFSLLTITMSVMVVITEPVWERLDVVCGEYGMSYEYRDGSDCLDDNNVLHPIVDDCSSLIWEDCNIKFVKIVGGE